MTAALARSPRLRAEGDGPLRAGTRVLPQETAIAISFDGSSHAVMMATPADLEDFAIGFSLAEGIVGSAGEIASLDIVAHEAGIELMMWLAAPCRDRLAQRRRRMAGPVGCGLCGLESLAEAARPAASVTGDLRMTPSDVVAAMAALPSLQSLNREAHAIHAAAFWRPGEGIVALREDVGRHNALDKLAGSLARSGIDGVSGAVLLTSRVSVEMVQKTARLGAGVLIAVSAPTDLAVRTAEACGLTLIALARGDAFEVFAHPSRITQPAGTRAGEAAAEASTGR